MCPRPVHLHHAQADNTETGAKRMKWTQGRNVALLTQIVSTGVQSLDGTTAHLAV